MTIDCQLFEKCICQTTSAIDEGVLKNVSGESMERKEKVHSSRLPASVLLSNLCFLSICSSDKIPLFLYAFSLSLSAYVLTAAGAMQ